MIYVLALDDMDDTIQGLEFDGGTRFSLQLAGEGRAILGLHNPLTVVGFQRSIGIHHFGEDLLWITYPHAGEIGTDVLSLTLKRVALDTEFLEEYLSSLGGSLFLEMGEQAGQHGFATLIGDPFTE